MLNRQNHIEVNVRLPNFPCHYSLCNTIVLDVKNHKIKIHTLKQNIEQQRKSFVNGENTYEKLKTKGERTGTLFL